MFLSQPHVQLQSVCNRFATLSSSLEYYLLPNLISQKITEFPLVVTRNLFFFFFGSNCYLYYSHQTQSTASIPLVPITKHQIQGKIEARKAHRIHL